LLCECLRDMSSHVRKLADEGRGPRELVDDDGLALALQVAQCSVFYQLF
jgi:hypothetical protein